MAMVPAAALHETARLLLEKGAERLQWSGSTGLRVPAAGINRLAHYAFRRVRRCLREDLIAEAIGRAYLAFVRLIERGLTALI
jgi:hypothetical protein